MTGRSIGHREIVLSDNFFDADWRLREGQVRESEIIKRHRFAVNPFSSLIRYFFRVRTIPLDSRLVHAQFNDPSVREE